MLTWVFRAIFAVVLLSVLVANLSSDLIAGAEDKTNFWAVLYSAGGMALFVFLLDLFTPKKKLSALAGVFFGLLVGMLLSLALAPAVTMITESYGIDLIAPAVKAIKWISSVPYDDLVGISNLSFSPVPEPTVFILFLFGIFGLVIIKWKAKAKSTIDRIYSDN